MNSIFPYPRAKQGQQLIMETIVKTESPMIIEAGTGTGKTVASLCGLLNKRAEGEKILIFVKTINQMNPVLKEWAAINRDNPVSILPLLGKIRLSKIKHRITKNTVIRCDDKKNNYKRKKLLKKLKSRNKRSRLLKLITWELVKDPTISNFKKILSSKENCPYYNSWSMLGTADIIVASYGYLNQLKRIEREAGIPIDKMHIIIDEAHNFAIDRFYSLEKHHLLMFMKLFYRDNFLKKVYDEIRGLRIITWEEIAPDHEKRIKIVLNRIDQAMRLVTTNSDQLKVFPPELLKNNILETLIRTVRQIFANYRTGSIIVSRDSINIVDFNPEKKFGRLKSAKSLILQSGTMTPARAFQKLYNLPSDTLLLDLMERDMRKIWKDKSSFKAYYVSSLTSKSRFRNDDLYKRYASVIRKIFDKTPSHILVLGPSYEFINNLARFINNKMIIETRLSTPGAIHHGIMKSKEKTIILGNQNGKIMEGNEWTVEGRSIVSTVIMTGLATRVPREADEIIFKIRSKILQNEYLANLFAHQIPLSIIANQSFGRTRRHPEDRGAIIILDDRVDEFMQRNLCLSRYNRLNDLLKEYEQFFGGSAC